MGDSKLVQHEIYEYDLNNNRIQKLTKNNNGIITTYYSYDSDNKLIEESTYNRIISYNYDSLGNLIEEISVNPLNNQFVSRQSYEYDSSNNLIKNDVFGNDSLKIVTFIFQYDIYNNLIEYQEESFSEYCLITNDCHHRITYEYDSNNNRTREIYHTDGYVLLNEYDSENIIVKQTHYNSTNESEYFITFEYDSNNNLLEEVRYEYQKGKLVSNQTETDPLNELCNQLNLPEQQLIPIICVE